MRSIQRAGSICFAVVLAFSMLTLAADARGQSAGVTETPRDTLLAAARDMIKEAKYCALITLDASGHPRARTMDALPPEENMVVWMGTSRVTRKVAEIRNDPRVTLYFAHPKHVGYVVLYGTAELVDTPEEKDKRWNEAYASYFPEGKASYILIAVTPKKMEIIDYSRGITGDPKTWQPATMVF
jgi:general stress protein 26